MSRYIHKSHNVSVLLYHLVCPAKYRRIIFDKTVDQEIKTICLELEKRFEIMFFEIGTDRDHVHFLIQSVPMYSPKRIVQAVKSITAREIFLRMPAVKKSLWGGEFWSDGYFINTVGKHNSETAVSNYIKEQGRSAEYIQLHKQQLQFDF